MANVHGSEQPAAEPDQDLAPESQASDGEPGHGGDESEAVCHAGDGDADNGWTVKHSAVEHSAVEHSAVKHDEPGVGGQVRHTDSDRWAASFANAADRTGDSAEAETQHQPWPDHPAAAQSASWSSRIPVPPSEPTWHTVGSGSGWGQPSYAAPAPPAAAPPTLPGTTDVPSGFSWGPDSNLSSGDRSRQGRGEVGVPSSSPPPPPTGYPRPAGPAPAQRVDESPGGQHAPGSQSRWSAEPAQAPNRSPAQQRQPQQGGPEGWQPGGQQVPQHSSAADLSAGSLVKAAPAVPRVGWRAIVHAVTGGTVNPGLSQAELRRRNLIERATAPVRGCHRIAVVSLKGGIGKTTTTAGIGLTLAEHRGDRVVALDANPDAGTLAERLTGQIDVTVRDLLDNLESIRSFTDVSAFTSLAARLQVLASEQDPEMSEAFSEKEYCTVSDVLARYFNIVLTDSGTGLLHSAMSGTLAVADSLVVVGSPSVDGASRASKTLDWLIAHGHGELVSRAVAVISTVRPASKELDMVRLRDHFAARVRGVVEIPYDRHLVTGGIIDMTQLDPPTEQAFLELAATVADGFRLPPLVRPEKQSP